MSVQTEARAAERRANLLAGLNDAPAGLIGWEVEDRSHVRLRTGELIPVSRYRRLDTMWWALKGGAYAEKVRTDQATRYHALTGRTFPDPHLRRVPKADLTAAVAKADAAARSTESSLMRFAGALQAIADGVVEAASRVVFPRLKFSGDPSQDDVVKGA